MTKRIVHREDGRAVIYFDFEDERPAERPETRERTGDADE